jgi:hypothetical protein
MLITPRTYRNLFVQRIQDLDRQSPVPAASVESWHVDG